MLRALVNTAYAVQQTLAISIPTVADAYLGRLTRERCDVRLAAWSGAILSQAGVEIEVHGRENVPSRPVVFMSNHASHLDVPILYQVCPGSLRMIAKAELFRIPIWGRAMGDAGFVAVARSGDRAQAKAAMTEAGRTIASGVSIWIAPEGTRTRDGRIGKLKRGGFRLAIETGTPIVPLFIAGAGEILPPGSRLLARGGKVRVDFGELIEVDGSDENTLIERVECFLRAH